MLRLVFESPSKEILVSPDNIVPMVKRLQGGGWGGHSGVTAATLAQKGLTAPLTIRVKIS